MKKFFILTLLLFSSAASALPTAGSNENMALKYEAYWSGIKVAEMRVYLNEQPDSYKYQALIDTVGILKQISKYWCTNTTTGKIAGGKYFPASFDTKWQPKKTQAQRIIVNYAKDGTVSETATPPENRNKRPEILQEYKRNIPDPITAAAIARQKASQIISSGLKLPQNFSVRTFDSRRVFDLNFAVKGYEKLKLGGKTRQLLKITLTRTPSAGFTKKELAKETEERPFFNIYVDDNFIPVVAYGRASIGQATISLVKGCFTADCKL